MLPTKYKKFYSTFVCIYGVVQSKIWTKLNEKQGQNNKWTPLDTKVQSTQYSWRMRGRTSYVSNLYLNSITTNDIIVCTVLGVPIVYVIE